MRRVDEPELLDEHDAPWPDVERSLRDLRRFNRYAGGNRAYRKMLEQLVIPSGSEGSGRPVTGSHRPDSSLRLGMTVLDIGAGSTDNVDALPDLKAIALDFKIDHLLYGRDRSKTKRVVGDARALPFLANAVDVVTSAHFIHHFSPDENVAILTESLRVSRVGVAVNDTRRHILPLLFVRSLAVLHLVGRITRSDAPGSVMRGYTIPEARRIADRVAAAKRAVVKFMPFRFGILLWKST